MSVSKEIIKKVNKRVTKARTDIANEIFNIRKQTMIDLARELLTLPLKERIKMAYRIVVKGKL